MKKEGHRESGERPPEKPPEKMAQRWYSPVIRQLFEHLRDKRPDTFTARTGIGHCTDGSCGGVRGNADWVDVTSANGCEKSEHDLSFGVTFTLLVSKRVLGTEVKNLFHEADDNKGT